MPELETRSFPSFIPLLTGDELCDGPSLLHSFVVLFLLSRLVPIPATLRGEVPKQNRSRQEMGGSFVKDGGPS